MLPLPHYHHYHHYTTANTIPDCHHCCIKQLQYFCLYHNSTTILHCENYHYHSIDYVPLSYLPALLLTTTTFIDYAIMPLPSRLWSGTLARYSSCFSLAFLVFHGSLEICSCRRCQAQQYSFAFTLCAASAMCCPLCDSVVVVLKCDLRIATDYVVADWLPLLMG